VDTAWFKCNLYSCLNYEVLLRKQKEILTQGVGDLARPSHQLNSKFQDSRVIREGTWPRSEKSVLLLRCTATLFQFQLDLLARQRVGALFLFRPKIGLSDIFFTLLRA
jgi:hypothetical protein